MYTVRSLQDVKRKVQKYSGFCKFYCRNICLNADDLEQIFFHFLTRMRERESDR